MKRILVILSVFLLSSGLLSAQDPRIAPTKIPLSEVERLKMPPLDNEALLDAELARRGPGIAPRFAEPMAVEVTPATHGTWEKISPAEAVWRLRLLSPGAYSLNLGFTRYHLPAGASLILYDPGRKRAMGPFTPADNEDHAQLWTPIFEGDELVIELRLAIDKRSELELLLSTVNHDFLNFANLVAADCHLDVNCGAADGWGTLESYRDLIQSVAVYGFGGASFCTGFLVNNTREDCAPYFMTANHCEVNALNAPSVTIYWNFENSRCRQPGSASGPGDGTLNDYNLGARFLAGWEPSDFTLLELDDPVSSSAGAYFAGWSATPEMGSDQLACIHHPNGDEKRISLAFTDTYVGAWGRGTDPVPEGNHLVVPSWDIGTTEVGSSGAPLINAMGRVIGQLHGGLAACDNDEYDQFGWFHRSWEGGGTPSTSLQYWLDPDSTGILEMDGRRNRSCSFFVDAVEGAQHICAPDTTSFNFLVSPNFEEPVTLQALNLPENAAGRFSPNPVQPGQTATLVIDNTGAVIPGTYDIRVLASSDSTAVATNVLLIISSEQPPVPLLENPSNGASEIKIAPSFSWEAPSGEARYRIQIAGDPDFRNIIRQENDLTDPLFQTERLLQPEQEYFWRVSAVNACGESAWSPPFRFRTAGIDCLARPVADVPVSISSIGRQTVRSVRSIDEPGTVISVTLKDLNIQHTFVGDLQATLTSPGGRTITLFDQLGVPAQALGCPNPDLQLSFSDDAPRSAQDLENSCEGQPAARGNFQPIDPLAGFRGEQAAGDWVLTVRDFNDQDGGAILSWNLELCISRPKNLTLKTDAGRFDACPEAPFSFDLEVGSGFNQNGVTLTASGLPAGVEARFSRNPALPGDTVTVLLQNLKDSNSFLFDITAFDGVDSSTQQVRIDLIPEPELPRLLTPSDRSRDVARQTLLSWNRAAATDRYRLLVAADSGFNQPFFERIVTDTFFILSGLDFQTTYYWRVESINACPASNVSPTYSFETIRDISLVTSTSQIEVCAQENPSFQFALGSGFENARLSYRVLPEAPLQLLFDRDTSMLRGGDIVKAVIGDLTLLSPGTYRIELSVFDANGSSTESIKLVLSAAPLIPSLLEPLNNARLGTSTPQMRWRQSPEAASYLLEISSRETFDGETRRIQLQDTSYLPATPLAPGTYYWRTTARNDCGNATTATRSFQVGTTALGVLPAGNVRLYPNPAGRDLFIDFRQTPKEQIRLELFGPDGRLIEQRNLSGASLYQIDLSTLAEGMYVVRLVSPGGTMVRRIVHAENR